MSCQEMWQPSMDSPEIDYGSFLVYAPKGESENSKRIKAVCLRVKDDGILRVGEKRLRAIPAFVELLHSELEKTDLRSLFSPAPILVPMPRSSLSKPGSFIPAQRICEEMMRVGIANSIAPILTRTKPVPKAAFSQPQDRPTIQQHMDSMSVEADLLSATVTRPMLVVDDVVTRGTSFIAAISLLQAYFPEASISAFAMVRVMSGAGVEVENLIEPYRGTIRASGKWGQRSP